MSQTIKLRRGTHATLPTTGMSEAEPLFTTDRGNIHVATGATTRMTATPALSELTTLASVDGTSDLVMLYDASEVAGQREKKMTFNSFKTALNIPAASSDELVAVVSGGTSGYIWGTTGADGILRAGASLSYTKDAGNAFVTFNVATGGIDTTQLADGAVTTVKIGDDQVTSAKIAAGAVDATALATNAVTTIKIADGAITNAKLAATALDVNATTFSGNGTTVELDIALIDGGTF